jgi:DtxR family transcriptional regulator, Mn-dependent transcriptional regulator
VIGVREDDTSFLKHLNDKGLTIGKSIIILSNDEYDNTLRVSVDDLELNLSGKVARSILIKPV